MLLHRIICASTKSKFSHSLSHTHTNAYSQEVRNRMFIIKHQNARQEFQIVNVRFHPPTQTQTHKSFRFFNHMLVYLWVTIYLSPRLFVYILCIIHWMTVWNLQAPCPPPVPVRKPLRTQLASIDGWHLLDMRHATIYARLTSSLWATFRAVFSPEYPTPESPEYPTTE